MQERPTYRMFQPEVTSNTLDFFVGWVCHHGRRMRGVFTRHGIPARDCPLFIGVYPGVMKNHADHHSKVVAYARLHAVDERTATRRVSAYSLSTSRHFPGCLLDPTDEQGILFPSFRSFLAGYLNEPPVNHQPKAAFVFNQPRQRYEVWLMKPVDEAEEIFIYYGEQYPRDYPIDTASTREHVSFRIPAESLLSLDLRGNPHLLNFHDDQLEDIDLGIRE